EKGLTAVKPISDNVILYCTAHFFKRYNERRKLNLVMPCDIIRAFMNDNLKFSFQKLEETTPGNFKVFGVTDSGVLLGMYNASANIYKLNTFITSDMLQGSQIQMEEQMKARLDKYQPKKG
ncbi:MAG TPA: hypothetical protein VNJ07_12695, partial [Chitinophagales bacterium]|nr:hypothetical protein [Chitinophagales bacterium]